MLNLGDIFNRVPELLGKDQYGKYVTPLNFNAAIKWANLQLEDKYIKEFESTREVSNNLRHLLKTLGTPEDPYLALDSFGRALFPDDYYYFSSGYIAQFLNACGSFTKTMNMLEWVDDATYAFRVSRDMVDSEYPIVKVTSIRQTDGTYLPAMQFYPKTPTAGITYLRRAVDPVFAYTLSGTTIIYDAANSVEPEWPENCYDTFVELVVQSYARNIHDQLDYGISKGEEATQ
jgi:hypothetical protein